MATQRRFLICPHCGMSGTYNVPVVWNEVCNFELKWGLTRVIYNANQGCKKLFNVLVDARVKIEVKEVD